MGKERGGGADALLSLLVLVDVVDDACRRGGRDGDGDARWPGGHGREEAKRVRGRIVEGTIRRPERN